MRCPPSPRSPSFNARGRPTSTTEALGGMLGKNPQGILIKFKMSCRRGLKASINIETGMALISSFLCLEFGTAGGRPKRQRSYLGLETIPVRPRLCTPGCVAYLDEKTIARTAFSIASFLRFLIPYRCAGRRPSYETQSKRRTPNSSHASMACPLIRTGARSFSAHPTAKALFIEWHDQHCGSKRTMPFPHSCVVPMPN